LLYTAAQQLPCLNHLPIYCFREITTCYYRSLWNRIVLLIFTAGYRGVGEEERGWVNDLFLQRVKHLGEINSLKDLLCTVLFF
jgi:hypothetical protein